MREIDRTFRWAVSVFRALCWLLPLSVRRELFEELWATFCARASDAAVLGLRSWTFFVSRELMGLLTMAVGARLSGLQRVGNVVREAVHFESSDGWGGLEPVAALAGAAPRRGGSGHPGGAAETTWQRPNGFSAADFMMRAGLPRDRRSYKIAGVVALVLHFLLFLIVIPMPGATLTAEAQPRQVVRLVKFPPPAPAESQPPPSERTPAKAATPVPIPAVLIETPIPVSPESDSLPAVDEQPIGAVSDFLLAPPTWSPPMALQLVRVGDIAAPRLFVRVKPDYPPLALRARRGGDVMIEARIGTDGRVYDARATTPAGLGLDEAAIAAVLQWRFTPSFYNGRPVEVLMIVEVTFHID